MKMAISFANGSPPISTGVNIAKQFLCIFRNLSSIQLFSIEENVPTSTSEGMEASQEQKEQLQHGMSEVEHFLSKLRTDLLLSPKESLNPEARTVGHIGNSHILEREDEMDVSQITQLQIQTCSLKFLDIECQKFKEETPLQSFRQHIYLNVTLYAGG